jgi:adenylate kinase
VLSRTLLDSDIIVFDLLDSLQEASQAVSCMQCFILDLADPNTQIATPKVFVAISTIMTWAKTKIENEEAEALVEDEYRRRKAHPNFKAHLALEKEIVKLGSKKSNLKTFVIAAGMIYHGGDSLFHYLFKVFALDLGRLAQRKGAFVLR